MERFWFNWYLKTYPVYRAWWRFRGWLTEASSIEEMIEQRKIIVHVLKADPSCREYAVRSELTVKEWAIWEEFQLSQMGPSTAGQTR